jgi:hypothetical protein
MRDATFQNVIAEPEPAVITPAKPTDASRPPQPFPGNRQARRAAAARARKAARRS